MRLVTTLVAALALAVAGCGGDDSKDTSASAPASSSETTTEQAASTVTIAGQKVESHGTATAESGKPLEVELDDNYFQPTVIEGEAGSQVTLELKNEGQAEHNLEIEDQKIDKDVEAGETANVKVKLPDSGELLFYCKYHRQLGMMGGLKVK